MVSPPDAFDRILASLYRAALDDAYWPAGIFTATSPRTKQYPAS